MLSDLLQPVSSTAANDTPKVPAHEQVYQALRAKVLFGDLAPGQAVTIQGLVQELGAGMTPVREALRRLIAEGALTHKGNRRVTVPMLTPQGVDELGFMRLALEPELARRAATRIAPPLLAALRQEDADLNDAIARGDIGGYLMHNYRFHLLVYSGANAPIMASTVNRLWLRFGPSLRVVCGRFGTSNLPDKHATLLDALTTGDATGARTAMAEDVEQGIVQIRAALENNGV